MLYGHCCEKLKPYYGEDMNARDRIQDTKTTCYVVQAHDDKNSTQNNYIYRNKSTKHIL
jgi:hypothetical protein